MNVLDDFSGVFYVFHSFQGFFYIEWRLTYNFDKNVAFIGIVFRGGGVVLKF